LLFFKLDLPAAKPEDLSWSSRREETRIAQGGA